MSTLDLEAIKIRAEWLKDCDERGGGTVGAVGLAAAALSSARDVPALLEEVRRLREETQELAAELAEARTELQQQDSELAWLRGESDDH